MTGLARSLIAGLLVICVATHPATTPQEDCGYDASTVDALTDEQLEDLEACLDRFGWTYDEFE